MKNKLKTMVDFPKYERYKDSGVEWLGQIPAEWDIKKFKFLSTIQRGKPITSQIEQFDEDAVPYLSMEYLRGGTATQFVRKDDLSIISEGETLLLWDGSNSGEFIKSRTGGLSSTIALIKFFEINNGYSWYFCSVTERMLRATTVGMGIPHVNGAELKNSLVCLPPIETQTRIAQFLDQKTALIDQAIAIKERQIELLNERKQIIIQQAVTKGLNPNAPMKDSGVEWIGQIPEHWEVRRNSTIFREIKMTGYDNLPVLSVSIHSGVSTKELNDEENIRSINKIEDRGTYKQVSPGDIAYNMMRAWQGGIGAVSVYGMVSPAYVVVRPILDLIAGYFEFLYRCPIFIQQMNWNSKGITDFRKRLYWDDFKNLLTILPPQQEQIQIVGFIQKNTVEINNYIEHQNQQIQALKEYKTTLINAAVTGKIKITAEMVANSC